MSSGEGSSPSIGVAPALQALPISHDSLLSVEQARTHLLDAAAQLLVRRGRAIAHESLPTLEANGRVLAIHQVSSLNVPSFDNAQMDGYVVRAADCVSGQARLEVTQRIAAGQVGTALASGTAARIFTGAPIPPGADAVVMQETCEAERSAEGQYVTVRHVPFAGEWIRRVGEDIYAGKQILAAGTRLSPLALGLAASVGLAALPVVRRLRVAVLFTGDELVMPGQSLKPGAIYNSNRFMLHALLENLGCRITDYGTIADTLAATRQILRDAAREHDLVIACGGVSVGEEDHVKAAVEAEGSLAMWRIAMKPGKPLAFGVLRRFFGEDEVGLERINSTRGVKETQDVEGARDIEDLENKEPAFFFGLPGNPVSALITFLLFVRPFMLRLQGVQEVLPKPLIMRADFAWPKADRRNEFLRVKINDAGGLDLFDNQSSSVLTSAVWGDGLVDNPAGATIAPGALVQFIPFLALLY